MSPQPPFSGVSRRALLSAFAALPVLSISARAQTAASGDTLPSWNEGVTKQAILNFVTAVTREGSPDFVSPDERIATFDNDGTLWVEHPMYTQLAFGLDRVKVLAPLHPEWKNTQPFKAILEGDMKTLAESGEHGMAELVVATHAGMTTEEFEKIVTDWLATARHPRFKRPYTELSYQPMIELLAYLRTNGFKTFIVSGGGIEFMRPWTERVYGVPPEQVVGSSIKTQFQMRDGRPELFRLAEVNFIDDKAGKPVGINERPARRIRIVAAATLSHQYISDRFLPDKAIDLVDERPPRFASRSNSLPTDIDQLERRATQFEIEKQALKKEDDANSRERLAVIGRSSPESARKPTPLRPIGKKRRI